MESSSLIFDNVPWPSRDDLEKNINRQGFSRSIRNVREGGKDFFYIFYILLLS